MAEPVMVGRMLLDPLPELPPNGVHAPRPPDEALVRSLNEQLPTLKVGWVLHQTIPLIGENKAKAGGFVICTLFSESYQRAGMEKRPASFLVRIYVCCSQAVYVTLTSQKTGQPETRSVTASFQVAEFYLIAGDYAVEFALTAPTNHRVGLTDLAALPADKWPVPSARLTTLQA